jgi:hypothetical protein
MKTGFPIQKYALSAFLVVLFLLGVFIAFLTYRYYSIVARGVLGIVSIYLLFFFARYSRIDISVDTLQLAPRKYRYSIFVLIAPVISYWATAQISDMVLYFWKR